MTAAPPRLQWSRDPAHAADVARAKAMLARVEMRENRAELREWFRGVITKPGPFADLKRLFGGLK